VALSADRGSSQLPQLLRPARPGRVAVTTSANQTVTIFCTILYNSYNIVTPYQFVQPVQPVQLHLQILYKRFDQRLYNLSEKVLGSLYNTLYNTELNIYRNLCKPFCRLYNLFVLIVQIVTLYISYNVVQ